MTDNTSPNPVLSDGYVSLPKNTTTLFHYSDSEEVFNYNLSRQPVDWEYRNSYGNLTYSFDELGFRNNTSLNDISKDTYIVTIGCSHTMGSGQYYNETYSYYLQDLTNLPVYNMGIAASCNEISALNIAWLLKNYRSPDAIVFQRTGIDRFPIPNPNNKTEKEVLLMGPWVAQTFPKQFHDLEFMMAISDKHRYSELKSVMNELMVKHLCDTLNVKLITIDIDQSLIDYNLEADRARDILHLGPKFNAYLAETIYKQYITLVP